MHKAPCPPDFDVMLAQPAAVERMPAIVDDDFPPDMGRMFG